MNELETVKNNSAIEAALIGGDLSKLSTDQRLHYYKKVCDSLGLNNLTKPFEYIQLNGKLTLYAKRDATDQLRKVHKISITITAREKIDDLYIVTARAKDASGREDESTGVVNVSGLKGENLANAFLKAETKAKRRVTLSICGLGLLDESEVETIKDAKFFTDSKPLPAVAQKIEPIPNKVDDTHLAPNTAPEYLPTNVDPDRGQDELDEYLGIDMSDIQHKVDTYVITFGKYTGKALSQVGLAECQRYTQYIKEQAARDGKEIKGKVLEFMDMVDLYSKVFQHETDKNYWRDNGHTADYRENKNQPHY